MVPDTPAPPAPPTVVSLRRGPTLDVVQRVSGRGAAVAALPSSPGTSIVAAARPPEAASAEDQLNTAIGCKTSEVALVLLAQVVSLEHENFATASEERVDELLVKATAMLAELEPVTATEAMLAAQMVGTQRAAMQFLERSTMPGQTPEAIEANVGRSVRLMRLFIDQAEAMSKLKGKSGQQRVVVEHVSVAAGGQAIVGTVIPGGGGRVGTTDDELHAPRRGWLRNGNPPGDPTQSPRCGARTRRQATCRGPAMRNGRCRMHGGMSTGPRTAAGLERSRRARWKHGGYSRETRAILANSRRQWWELWALLSNA